MIKYRLTCAEGHDFESWFASGAEYDRLDRAGLLSCAVCGSERVSKAIMAPQVASSTEAAPLSQPASPAEQAVRRLREKIERDADDVGKNFAKQARMIHNGEAPERAIYGQAKPSEVRGLLQDGVPVLPLPWSDKKTN